MVISTIISLLYNGEICVSVRQFLPKFELNQSGHNSVNLKAIASRFCMVVALEEEDGVEEVDDDDEDNDDDDDDTSKNVFFLHFIFFAFFEFLHFFVFFAFLAAIAALYLGSSLTHWRVQN